MSCDVWRQRDFQLVPGMSVGEIVDALNASDSGFDALLDPANWTRAPETRNLSEGKGYMSVVYGLRFHTTGGDERVVLKVSSSTQCMTAEGVEDGNDDDDVHFHSIADGHRNELTVYRLFKKHGCGDLKLLKFFGGREASLERAGFLLLEDASAHATTHTFTGISDFTESQVKEAIVEIAKLQAAGFRFSADEREQIGTSDRALALTHAFVHDIFTQIAALGLPCLTPARLKALHATNGPQAFHTKMTLQEKYGLPAVLTHDDFWIANLILADTGRLVAVIDWQTAKFGNFTHDLAVLLVLVLSGEERRARQEAYLQFYLEQLHAQLKHFDIRNADGFDRLTIDVVHKVYRESLPWALVNVVFTVLVYMDKNRSDDGKENAVVNRLRCCLEDLWP